MHFFLQNTLILRYNYILKIFFHQWDSVIIPYILGNVKRAQFVNLLVADEDVNQQKVVLYASKIVKKTRTYVRTHTRTHTVLTYLLELLGIRNNAHFIML